jgi:HPt (histidine-containing phosphotransfer) domain-containing protein
MLNKWSEFNIHLPEAWKTKKKETAVATGAEQMREYRQAEKETDDIPPIDQSVLRNLQKLQVEGESSIVESIVNAYLNGSQSLVAQMREMLSINDLEVLQQTAHSLKSSSANVGAMQLSAMSMELEMKCKNKHPGSIGELVAAIEMEFPRVKNALITEVATCDG